MTKQDDIHQNSHNSSNSGYHHRPVNPYMSGGMNSSLVPHNSLNSGYPSRTVFPYIRGGMNSNLVPHNSLNSGYHHRPVNPYMPGGMNSYLVPLPSNPRYLPPRMIPHIRGGGYPPRGVASNVDQENSTSSFGMNRIYPPRPPTVRDLHKTVKRGIQDQQDQQQQQDQQNIREETEINPETVLQVQAMKNETVNEDDSSQMENFKRDIANLGLTSPDDREERIRQMKLIMKIFNYYKKHCRGNQDFTVDDKILYNTCLQFKDLIPRRKLDTLRKDWKNFYLYPKLRELYIDKAPHLGHFHIRDWRNNDFHDQRKREKYRKKMNEKYRKAKARRREYNKLVNEKTSSIKKLNREVRKGQQEQESDEDGGMDANDM